MLKGKHIDYLAFILLTVFLLFFYTMVFFQTTKASTIIFFGLFLLLLAGMNFEKSKIMHEKSPLSQELKIIIFITAGAVATFMLSPAFGPVIAASSVGLLYKLFAGNKDGFACMSRPVYCGAFVGMSSAPSFGITSVAFAGILAGFVYIASHKAYNETGGTMGTIAFIGTFIAALLTGALGA